jgi:uncharacterized membrane protein
MHFYWSQIPIFVVVLLHVYFMYRELRPWGKPKVMDLVLPNWPQEHIPAVMPMIIHNAGFYNGIVAAGLIAASLVGPNAFPVQVVLLCGGIAAGVFGAITLKTRLVYAQAIVGVLMLVPVICLQGG